MPAKTPLPHKNNLEKKHINHAQYIHPLTLFSNKKTLQQLG